MNLFPKHLDDAQTTLFLRGGRAAEESVLLEARALA